MSPTTPYNTLASVPGAILQRYAELLKSNGFKPIAQDDDDPFNGNHIYWMLMQVQHGKLSSVSKEHRWTGFIQAGMVVLNLTTVSQERTLTRTLFDGN